jgi:ribosomal protein L35AE/L33A
MWYYNGEQFKLENYPNDSLVGFVYEITEKDTGKKYIGKKLFWSTRRKKY